MRCRRRGDRRGLEPLCRSRVRRPPAAEWRRTQPVRQPPPLTAWRRADRANSRWECASRRPQHAAAPADGKQVSGLCSLSRITCVCAGGHGRSGGISLARGRAVSWHRESHEFRHLTPVRAGSFTACDAKDAYDVEEAVGLPYIPPAFGTVPAYVVPVDVSSLVRARATRVLYPYDHRPGRFAVLHTHHCGLGVGLRPITTYITPPAPPFARPAAAQPRRSLAGGRSRDRARLQCVC